MEEEQEKSLGTGCGGNERPQKATGEGNGEVKQEEGRQRRKRHWSNTRD